MSYHFLGCVHFSLSSLVTIFFLNLVHESYLKKSFEMREKRSESGPKVVTFGLWCTAWISWLSSKMYLNRFKSKERVVLLLLNLEPDFAERTERNVSPSTDFILHEYPIGIQSKTETREETEKRKGSHGSQRHREGGKLRNPKQIHFFSFRKSKTTSCRVFYSPLLFLSFPLNLIPFCPSPCSSLHSWSLFSFRDVIYSFCFFSFFLLHFFLSLSSCVSKSNLLLSLVVSSLTNLKMNREAKVRKTWRGQSGEQTIAEASSFFLFEINLT